MPISSSAPTAAYASSRPISAVSSATSSGASSGMKICGKRSYGRCSWPGACWNRSAASAVARSIPCTRQRSSASARAKRTHAAALPGNPYDGHTLATVIPQMQALIGNILDRCITDAGYRGHNAPLDHKFKVYTAGQKRRVTPQIKREFKRRAAIEPVIGHLKEHHRMGRNYLAHASGDAINAVLAAAGYNFRRLLAWLRLLLLRILIALGL